MSTIINLCDITPPPMVENLEACVDNFVEMLRDEKEYYKRNPDVEEEEEEEEDEECEVCDTKTKTTIKTYGCMDMSVCKNCELCCGYECEKEEELVNCDFCENLSVVFWEKGGCFVCRDCAKNFIKNCKLLTE